MIRYKCHKCGRIVQASPKSCEERQLYYESTYVTSDGKKIPQLYKMTFCGLCILKFKRKGTWNSARQSSNDIKNRFIKGNTTPEKA
jgi:hypothetical protein